MKFRKRPVVVEAIQFQIDSNGKPNLDEIREFLGTSYLSSSVAGNSFVVKVRTHGDEVTACPGDWLVRGVAGEFYPCKKGIFEQTHEPVEDDEA